MKCPACFKELAQLRVGNFTVDACQGGCGGIWFDAFELQKVDESHETEGNVLLHIPFDPDRAVDHSRKRECPRCSGVKLQRHFYSAARRVQVDHCPNCAGYWLDAGELAQIQAERTGSTKPQARPGTSVSGDFIRYLYRLQGQGEPKP
ncbi:MAG TPA: zf-TFIIB domain-containing protein [Clostridia bacterium]|nr:zf-TFIIB domain-containing protein [Clostridia bacterium]